MTSLKQERDRLLEISSDLKIQVTQSEKKKFMLSNASQGPAQSEGNYGEERKASHSDTLANHTISRSIQ